MRILMVGLATFDQMTGGSARYLSGVSDGLRRLGHSVDVRTAARHVATPGYTERGLIGQLRRAAVRLLVVMPGTFATVLARPPDLINSHFALDGLPAVLAARLVGRPVVVTFHGPWALEAVATGRRGAWPLSTAVRAGIEGFVYRRAQRCVCLSQAFADVLVARYGVDRARIRVMPGGIDVARFRGLPGPVEARRALGLPERHTIVTVRRLVPRMGLDMAIEALARLSSTVDAQLVVAGSGPEREALAALAAERGVADRVLFLGRVPEEDLPMLYASGDVCVVPSRELEGFGYTALEALAAGTPVICVGTGGLAELVGGLEPRWVLGPDPGAIADVIGRLASEAAAFPDHAACAAYAATMEWTRVLPRIVAVFEEAIGETRRTGRGGRARPVKPAGGGSGRTPED